ncbi:MAG: hypothetical protein KAH48_09590, partial [Chlorobi bacterium]|nr:hypothetical protein [Chlorobiota bacterium]
MKIRLGLILIVIAGFCSQILNAGQLGSFDVNLDFKGTNRSISCYVGSDYADETPAGLLIGLHGAGHNGTDYRNVLIQQARWNTVFPNTVMIFPDGGEDQSSDFYSPDGDEAIIDSVIAWAKRNYNIDESDIILQGFSLGGRSALKYGLDNSEIVAGLILHTPAMQSPLDVQNVPGFSSFFAYDKCDKMPITICHGAEDYGFLKTVRMLADTLVAHNAKLLYMLIPEFAHSIPQNNITTMMHEFISDPMEEAVPTLYKLSAADMVFDDKITLNCTAMNLGNVPVTSMTFQYELNGEAKTFDWSGNLTNDQHANVELELTDMPVG